MLTADTPLFVISGIQGAGKSTVARLLAARFERGAWVSADALQTMVVSGQRWPEGAAMSPEARAQLRLRLRHACLLARSFVAAGFAAVVDDIVIGERVEHLLAELGDHPFTFVMLTPRLEVVREREAERGTELWRQWAWLDEEVRQRTQGHFITSGGSLRWTRRPNSRARSLRPAATARPCIQNGPVRSQQVMKWPCQRTRRLGLWLDTSEQTPEETVDAIMARAAGSQ